MATIAFLLVVPVSISFYNDYQVFNKGNLVSVIVTAFPSNYSYKSGFLKFEFNGRMYDKRAYAHGNYRLGQTLQLRYLEGYEDNFLFINENPSYSSVFLIILLVILGIYSIYYAIIRKPLK